MDKDNAANARLILFMLILPWESPLLRAADGLFQKKLLYEENSFVQLKIQSLSAEVVAFVLGQQVPDWCARFLSGSDHLLCLARTDARIVLTLHDHERLLDLLNVI